MSVLLLLNLGDATMYIPWVLGISRMECGLERTSVCTGEGWGDWTGLDPISLQQPTTPPLPPFRVHLVIKSTVLSTVKYLQITGDNEMETAAQLRAWTGWILMELTLEGENSLLADCLTRDIFPVEQSLPVHISSIFEVVAGFFQTNPPCRRVAVSEE